MPVSGKQLFPDVQSELAKLIDRRHLQPVQEKYTKIQKIFKTLAARFADDRSRMTKKHDGIVVEIDERIAVTNEEQQFEAYCSECKKMTDMATPKTAGVLTETSEREVFRLIEGKEIHFIESARVLVCIESLRDLKADSNTTSA